MTGDDDRARAGYDEPRVPNPLRDRVEAIFVAERGYEPASFQEALAAVVDVAEAAADDQGTSSGPGRASRHDHPASGRAPGTPSAGASELPQATEGNTDPTAAPPEDAPDSRPPSAGTSEGTSEEPTDEDRPDTPDVTVVHEDDDSVSFDEYVDGLEAIGDGPSPSVESILETEHADGVVRELAEEVLEEMTQDAFQELEHGVDEGTGAGVADGRGGTQTADGGDTAPSGSDGDGVPSSLTADPESDCAVCGRAHRVSVLQTTILDEDGSVALVCPSCAE